MNMIIISQSLTVCLSFLQWIHFCSAVSKVKQFLWLSSSTTSDLYLIVEQLDQRCYG